MRPLDGLIKAISKLEPINLHVVDIENLAGSGKLTESVVKSIQREYTSATKSTADDLYLIAAGPQNKHVLFSGWTHGTAIYQFRKGKDGADMALVSLFSQIEHPEVFEHIFLASGDGGLSIIAERAQVLGADVTVVTGAGARSWKYRGHKALQITGGF